MDRDKKNVRVFEARLLCVHPLCCRWPATSKAVYRIIWMPADADPVSMARHSFANKAERKCKECHRVISLEHLVLREMNPDTGDYLDTEALS